MRVLFGTILATAMVVSNVGLANAKPMAELDANGVVVNGEVACDVERRAFPDGEAVRYRLAGREVAVALHVVL